MLQVQSETALRSAVSSLAVDTAVVGHKLLLAIEAGTELLEGPEASDGGPEGTLAGAWHEAFNHATKQLGNLDATAEMAKDPDVDLPTRLVCLHVANASFKGIIWEGRTVEQSLVSAAGDAISTENEDQHIHLLNTSRRLDMCLTAAGTLIGAEFLLVRVLVVCVRCVRAGGSSATMC
jgi:hypothetical protein